jgi:hypothetical protein
MSKVGERSILPMGGLQPGKEAIDEEAPKDGLDKALRGPVALCEENFPVTATEEVMLVAAIACWCVI